MQELLTKLTIYLRQVIEDILTNHSSGRMFFREAMTQYDESLDTLDLSVEADTLTTVFITQLALEAAGDRQGFSVVSILLEIRDYIEPVRQADYDIFLVDVYKYLEQYEAQQRRRLDAAMPAECTINIPAEIRVLIAIPSSIGLKAYLPDYTESGEIITKGDVTDSNVRVIFPTDPGTGKLLPAHLWLRVSAPNFDIHEGVQGVQVLPDDDSGMFTFICIPRTPNAKDRVEVGVYLDRELSTKIGSVSLQTVVYANATSIISQVAWKLVSLVIGTKKPLEPPSTSLGRPTIPQLGSDFHTSYIAHVENMHSTITVEGDNRGLVAGADIKDTNLVNAGDVDGSYNAIGVGAQVVINHVQQAHSKIDALTDEMKLAQSQLADAIGHRIGQLTNAVEQAKRLERPNPYRSLLDYKLEDAPYFYGRDQAIGDLLGKIHSNRLTVLHADSGAGKSSLLQAGLASRVLAAGHLPLYLRPYDRSPIDFIKRAFLPNLTALPEFTRFAQMPLVGFLDAVTRNLGASTLYIFLDQFEEFFVELSNEEQADFVTELADCLNRTGLDVRWVLSLRKEYFSDLNRFTPRIAPFENEYFLATFQPEEAQTVIVEPARKHGVTYESEELIDLMLADLREADGRLQPPQIQLVCYELFEEVLASESPDQITFELYNRPRGRGQRGAQGILSNHLSRVLERMPANDSKLARRILEALVTSQTRRVRVAHDKLMAYLQGQPQTNHPTEMDAVLNRLIDSRLLRSDEDEDDMPVYELSHDYLLADIELDPELLAQKAAQELLNQEVVAYKRFGTLLNQEKYEIINSQRTTLIVDKPGLELLTRSEEAIQAQERAQEAGRRKTLIRTRLALGASLVALVFATVLAVPTIRDWMRMNSARSQGELVPIAESEVLLGNNLLYGDEEDDDDDRLALPEQRYAIPAFEIEAYEVTVQRYRLCMESGPCGRPLGDKALYELPERADYPITNVTVFQAQDFCNWIGRNLPTVYEWERAARYIDGRHWPWSNEPPISTEQAILTYEMSEELEEDDDMEDDEETNDLDYPEIMTVAAVGSAKKGFSQEGIYDLAGNVWEWTDTWVKDKRGANKFFIKGGSAKFKPSMLQSMAIHQSASTTYYDDELGFRCAVSKSDDVRKLTNREE